MPSCTIDQLPLELLVQIFDYVRHPSSSAGPTQEPPTIDPSIVACLLCCRRWHEIALPLLYRDVALRNQKLASFTQRFLSQPHRKNHQDVLKSVKSLTVSLNPKRLVETQEGIPLLETEEEEHAIIQELLLPLEKLPAVLSQMTNLTTFSLSIDIYGQYEPNRGTIGSILQSLPESCVNLELDLDHYYNRLGTGLNHVCEEVAKCLPRLHHLRLQLGTLCPDILRQDFSRSGFIKAEAQFRPPTYPSLRTLIINCGFYGDILTCNEDRSQPPNERDLSYPRARTTLVQSLRELVLRGAFPNIERLWLIDGTVKVGLTNERESSAWNRRDVAQNKTWAMPWTTLHGGEGFPILITRLPNGQELITADHTDMAVLAEGQTWKETITGTRLPAAISDDLEKGKHLMKDAPTISLSDYRKISPRGSCTWWIQDARTGTTTVSATEREGLVDRSLVLATTPPGWRWELVDGIPSKLVRETSVT